MTDQVKFLLLKKGICNVTNGKEKKLNTREGEVVCLTNGKDKTHAISMGNQGILKGTAIQREVWNRMKTKEKHLMKTSPLLMTQTM